MKSIQSMIMRRLVDIAVAILMAAQASAERAEEQDFEVARAEYEQAFEVARAEYEQANPRDEAARLRYVNKLAQLTEQRMSGQWRAQRDNPEYKKLADAINAELKKHPAPSDVDSKKLSQLLVGKWASPRRVYIFRANGKWGSEDGPVDTNWRIQGNQIFMPSQRSTIILLSSDYLIYAREDAVFFHSRVKK
jgi:hypothetical protein